MIYRSYGKKAAAAASAATLILSLAGCGEDTIYSASYDGNDIPAGIYIYCLMNKYYEAQSHMTETDTDVFAITIDDKNAKDWITDGAKDEVRRYAALEKKFSEYGLSLSAEQSESSKISMDQAWDYYGEYYEKFGISQASALKMYRSSLKSDMIFDHIYGEDGENTVSDDELLAYMNENYALINYIDMHLVDGDENLLKSDGKAEIKALAEEYVSRIKAGEDIDEISKEFSAYMEEHYPAPAAGTDALAADDTVTAETAETVTESEVSETAAEETASEEVTSVNVEESDASSDDETGEEEVSDENGNVWAGEDNTSDESGSVWAGEDDADTESESTGDISEDELISMLGGTDGAAEDDFTSNKQVIRKDSEVPDKTVNEQVFSGMKAGDVLFIEEDEHYYIVQKFDFEEDMNYFISSRESLLHEMKDEEFEALEESWKNETAVTFNDKATARYTPDMFKADET